MTAKRSGKWLALSALVLLAWVTFPANLSANHPWGPYHWARTANPFTIKLVRHLTTTWRPYLDLASAAWTTSVKLNTTIINSVSDATTRQLCPVVNGQVVVCNYTYGLTGWRGLATIWIDAQSHIYRGTSKMNDSYTWTPGNRQLVMCQEVGHTFGLGHQDETFNNANLGTCMDYTSFPFGPPNNLALNQHDHDQLNVIYAHTDNYTTITSLLVEPLAPEADSIDFNQPNEWGFLKASFNDGRTEVYERLLTNGHRVATFVIWDKD